MRLLKKRGHYYIEIERDKCRTLRTDNHEEAMKLFAIIKTELALINTYKIIAIEQEKILADIENRHTRLMTLLGQSDNLLIDKNRRNGSFNTEIEFQNHVISRLPEMGIYNIEQFKAFENGIPDALGTHQQGRTIIFEFKLGSIREEYLGQCLRYIKNKRINADEIWLIAEYSDEKRISVFADFPKIRLFVLSKDKRSKYIIREINCGTPAVHKKVRLIKSND